MGDTVASHLDTGTEQRQAHLALKLLAVAAGVRTVYLVLVATFALIFDDYDTSTSIISGSCKEDWPDKAAAAQQYLPGVVWDSIFLHRIAACGYEYEQFFAFYPGVPGFIRLLQAAGVLPGPWGFATLGLVLNNLAFLLSVWLLTRLSQQLVQDERVVSTAVLLFIFSPASIHHSMVYTEAMFTLTSWLGLYCLYCHGSSLTASLAFAASSAVRSNGLLNAGFILHEHGRQVLQAVYSRQWASAIKQGLIAGCCTAICAFPYLAYMLFSYKEFCTGVYGEGGSYPQRPWCNQTFPSAYGYVQKVYWQVGFLKYYRVNQLPNFLLAGPTLAISLWGALAYAAASPHIFITGGLLPQPLLQKWFGRTDSSSSTPNNSSCGSTDSSVTAAGQLLGCCRLVLCIVGRQSYCSSCAGPGGEDAGNAAAAVVKSPAIPGVAFQSLRQRQHDVAVQKHDLQQQGDDAGQHLQHSKDRSRVAGDEVPKGTAAGSKHSCISNGSSSRATVDDNRGVQPQASCDSMHGTKKPGGCSCSSNGAYYRPAIAVFVVHWLVLTLVCLAVVHIQVATRLLSSCVPLYWFGALLMLHKGPVLRWLLWWYSCAFMGVGAVFFVNFYPWV